MKIAYFDCIAGASGDMILGALVDAGLPENVLKSKLAALKIKDFDIKISRVQKKGFSATKVDVLVNDTVHARHLAEIKKIINDSDLESEIKQKAVAIIHRLGEVEAGIHNTELEKVHLHELGGVDTIVDVVGALIGIKSLGIQKIYGSPLPLGHGFIKGAHGQIPLPAPATIALLKNVPVVGVEVEAETVTPTGAVLLSSLVDSFGVIPAMILSAIGYGAGGRDLPVPNILRLLIGDNAEHVNEKNIDTIIRLETNIDDLNPEIYEYVMEKLFQSGALDVFLTPIQMKKNRPAMMVTVLCSPEKIQPLKEILFSETSTLGIRQQAMQRDCLMRKLIQIQTPFGEVQAKMALLPDGSTKIFPEYEDCRRLARQKNVPLLEIYRLVMQNVSMQG
ncbi:nickel pincer cofactor biosynthesis protein LarC [candidate division KSB1 bacterium]|nr:nickel pincer cofactor biosynthesis protein LarC [candidate division KSB1 bacterium]